MTRLTHLAAVLGLAAVAAPSAAQEAAQQRSGAHGLALPASFAGVLPCADCPGIRHHLDLWGDSGGFVLQREYIDRDRTETVMGRWHVDPARRALILRSEAGEEMGWQILNSGDLRMLDQEGNPIESELPYELAAGPLEPVDLAATLTGTFVYFADSGLFTECLTGQRMPVVMEGAYIDLERAYLAAGLPPMAPLLVRIDAVLAEAEAMEGPARRSVRVERLDHVTPHGACATQRAPAPLVNSFWRIDTVEGRPLPADAGLREPYLLLFEDTDGAPRFSATLGCNMMMGGFTLEGEALEFGAAASTMMACPPPLDGLEPVLAEALGATSGFVTDGHGLSLIDADGRIRASLTAVHTPW
jgi:copper homeostasis protein (lipoprotein)